MFELGRLGFAKTFVLFTFLVCFYSAIGNESPANNGDSTADEESDAWVDPGDMLPTDFSSFTTEAYKKEEKKQQEETVGDDATAPPLEVKEHSNTAVPLNKPQNCDSPYFKQLTRQIIELFQTPGKRYSTIIQLSEDDLNMLREFKEDDTKGERISDVFQLIIGIFKRIQEDEMFEQSLPNRILLMVEYHKEIFALIFIISVLIFILLIFESRTTLTWRQQSWYLFGLFFMISIPWEWFRLYRKEFAVKQADLIKSIPNHCATKNITITERLSLWMTSLLSWREDECIKYQEAILVDPMWEVSPSLAVSITATRLVFEPLEYIADSCGRSLKAFLKHVPAVWHPIMIVIILVLLLFCILLLTKSRIKFGFFEIGPTTTHARLERQEVVAITNFIRQEIRDIRREIAPVRVGNVEEIPEIKGAVQDERADDRNNPRVVRQTESPDVPNP